MSYNAIHAWARSVAQYGMQVGYASIGSTAGTLLSTMSLGTGAHSVTAKFEPRSTNAFPPSTSSPITVTVTSGGMQGETVNVTIPSYEGVFTMTVSNTPVQLSTPVLSADHTTFESTGQLGAVTISDGRYQSQPGWSVSGQVGDFTGGGHPFSGSYLGWTPAVTTQNAAHDVVVGPMVPPGTNPGLKGGSVLANAAATKGLDTTVLDAALALKVPASAAASSHSATLTITAVERAW